MNRITALALGLASWRGMSIAAIAPVLAGVAIVSPAPVSAAELSQWEFDTTTYQLTVTVSEEVIPQYFLLAQPARIIIDLPGTNLAIQPEMQRYSGAVRSIRVGQFEPGLTRIVIEMSSDAVFANPQVELSQIDSDRWAIQPLLVAESGQVATETTADEMADAPSNETLSADAVSPETALTIEEPAQEQVAQEQVAQEPIAQEQSTDVIAADVSSAIETPETVNDRPGQPITELVFERGESPSVSQPEPPAAIELAVAPPASEVIAEPEVESVVPATESAQPMEMTDPTAAPTVPAMQTNWLNPEELNDPLGALVDPIPTPQETTVEAPFDRVLDATRETSNATDFNGFDATIPTPGVIFVPTVQPPSSDEQPRSSSPTSPDADRTTQAAPAPSATELAEAETTEEVNPIAQNSPSPDDSVSADDLVGNEVANEAISMPERVTAGEEFPTLEPAAIANSESEVEQPIALNTQDAQDVRSQPAIPQLETAAQADDRSSETSGTATIQFGQPLFESAANVETNVATTNLEQAAAISTPEAVEQSSTRDSDIAVGTVLSLIYPGDRPLTLESGAFWQEVLLLRSPLHDRSGQVIAPAGSTVIGRFEIQQQTVKFVVQAIALENQMLRLDEDAAIVYWQMAAPIVIQPNQEIEVPVTEVISQS